MERTIHNATWCVNAPWAHPIWSWYAMLLVDLVTPGNPPPLKIRDDVTHELSVWALDPEGDATYREGKLLTSDAMPLLGGKLLQPVNHVYQWRSRTNALAEARGEDVFWRIKHRELNPDTDGRHAWDREYDWLSTRGF